MSSIVFIGMADVMKEAKALNFNISARQAEKLLKNCARKLNSALRDAAKEVIKEEVEMFWLDAEDKQLS